MSNRASGAELATSEYLYGQKGESKASNITMGMMLALACHADTSEREINELDW